jgi:hypothetical protein
MNRAVVVPPILPRVRYDGALRVVIAADAFLSAVAALAGVASPVVAVLPMTASAGAVVGLVALGAALLLAALGAVTAVLLALRMRDGHADIPRDLWLPLPAAMVPDLSGPPAPRARGGGPRSGISEMTIRVPSPATNIIGSSAGPETSLSPRTSR